MQLRLLTLCCYWKADCVFHRLQYVLSSWLVANCSGISLSRLHPTASTPIVILVSMTGSFSSLWVNLPASEIQFGLHLCTLRRVCPLAEVLKCTIQRISEKELSNLIAIQIYLSWRSQICTLVRRGSSCSSACDCYRMTGIRAYLQHTFYFCCLF